MKPTRLPFLLLVFLCTIFSAQAAVNLKMATNPPVPEQQLEWSDHFTVESFVKADFKSLEKASQKKLSVRDKIVIKIAQRKLKNELRKGNTIDLDDYYHRSDRRFSIGGFLLGFFFPIIGSLVAILFGGNAFRSSLLGLLCAIIVGLIVAVA